MRRQKLIGCGLILALIITVVAGCFEKKPNPPNPTHDLTITEVGSSYYVDIPRWLEVYNNSTQGIQLADYKLRSHGVLRVSPYTINSSPVVYNLPSLVIPSGAYAIIAGKAVDNLNNGESVVYTYNSGNNTTPYWEESGFVELVKDGATVDFVRFGTDNTAPLTSNQWNGGGAPALPFNAAGYGNSIALSGDNADTNSSNDWIARSFATPGGPNDVTSNTDDDQDGIPDCSEVPGTTFAGLPLYDWGARTGKRDLFIHINYMNSGDPGMKPRQEALDKVVAAFAAKNIALHFDVGTLYTQYNLDNESHMVPYAAYVSTEYSPGVAWVYNYKSLYMPVAKKQIFHYMLMGDQQSPNNYSSGIAELPGNDFVITMGHWGLATDTTANLNRLINYQAGTIMHEFGHNLNLRHGGSDHMNYKPNFYSIMNYMYQLEGLPAIGNNEGDRFYYWRIYYLGQNQYSSYLPSGETSLINSPRSSSMVIDYSSGNGQGLNEASVVESQGLRQSGSTGIDFNGNGSAGDTLTNFDLNNNNTTSESYNDYNDWNHIDFFFIRHWAVDLGGVSREKNINLKIMKSPLGDDQQQVIVETLSPPQGER